ncbi:MAG: fructosamine kinase family protein [Bacteroidia bacterium]
MIPDKLFSSLSDAAIVSANPLEGGSINDCYHVNLKDNREFFVKKNEASKYPNMFHYEALGLAQLQKAGASIPTVLQQLVIDDAQYLILSYHKKQSANALQWEDAGKMLAKMHQTSSSTFGLDYDNYMGSLVQTNRKASTFHEFFILERLEPQIKLARDKSALFPTHAAQFERLFDKLENLIPKEKPSLVHGDLWSGNFHPSAGGVLLIDPAIAFSHREVDLAMSTLFGAGPEAFYRGYQGVLRTENKPEERYPIYNLYPLLVHLNLFGSSYRSDIETILARFI